MGTSAFDTLWGGEPPQTAKPTKPPVPSPHAKFDALWDTPAAAPQTPTSYFPPAQPAEPAPSPGVFARAMDDLSGLAHHPIDAIEGVIAGPIKSAFTAVVSPGVGEARRDARLSKGGNSTGRPIDTTPYDAAHGGVTPLERSRAGVQSLVNAALPATRMASGAAGRAVMSLAGGAAAGAAYNPDDPKAGAVAGGLLGGLLHAGGAAVKGAGSVAVDVAGRPMENTPVNVAGMRVGTIEGVRPRATRINADALRAVPADGLSPFSEKPVAPMDVTGTAGVRTVRGLKTASPAAESIVKDALQQRADDAVHRVIQHGLEATGLATRENGLQVVDDMIAQRTAHGNAAYQPVFAKYNQPLKVPAFSEIAQTPAGQQALKRAGVIASNRSDPIGAAPAIDPTALTPDKMALYERLLKLNGGQTEPTLAAMRQLGESVPGRVQLALTLRQAHYVKLAFDDMLESAPEPGTGGLGPNNAAAIRLLKKRWVMAMDQAAPEYAKARKLFADESDLVRGAEFGRTLFKLDPSIAEKTMRELPQAAQEVARRTGFDALAERIENGPADVERGVSKIRDNRRMRLLFPDQNGFDAFRQGLGEEARLHANEQGALGGSITADKLTDVASMAGVSLPDVMRTAASGRWHQLLGRAAAGVTRKVMGPNADRLNAERARQLVAGANGDLDARNAALEALGLISPQQPPRPGTAWAQGSALHRPELLTASPPPPSTLPHGVPAERRLPFTTPTIGDAQQGAAMPIGGRIPMERRLPSAGPSPVPTVGPNLFGPAMPMGGATLDQQVSAAMTRLYRKNPEWAVSLSKHDQTRLQDRLRELLAPTP